MTDQTARWKKNDRSGLKAVAPSSYHSQICSDVAYFANLESTSFC